MDWHLVAEIFSYIAGSTLAISALPQIIMILKTKSVKGVSLFTNTLLTIGNYSWLLYGMINGVFSMIIFNTLSGTSFLIVTILTLVDKIKTKKLAHNQDSNASPSNQEEVVEKSNKENQ